MSARSASARVRVGVVFPPPLPGAGAARGLLSPFPEVGLQNRMQPSTSAAALPGRNANVRNECTTGYMGPLYPAVHQHLAAATTPSQTLPGETISPEQDRISPGQDRLHSGTQEPPCSVTISSPTVMQGMTSPSMNRWAVNKCQWGM